MIKLALKELCLDNEIGKYGIPASAEEFDAKKVRYLRITDIDDFGNLLNNDKKSVSANDLDKYLLKEGDIVFARTGNSTGRTYYHEAKNGDLAFAGFLIKYGLDSKKINPKYLKYYTLSSEYKQWVKNLSVGSTRGNINAFTFANCPISVPERKQQNLLVNVLSALDYKIELNNQINAELEAMAKTLYDYWFVQFDFPFGSAQGKPFDFAPFDSAQDPESQNAPVAEQNSSVAERKRTEAEESRTVAERSRGYKSSGGKMVYNEVLKREIPEGWEVKNIFDVAKVQYGFPFSTQFFNADEVGVPVIRIRDILENSISNYSSEKNVDEKYLINKGDLLIGMDGNFHINYWSKNGCYLNQRVVMIKEKNIPNMLVKYQIEPYIKLREKSVSRTTVGHLSDKDLKRLNILVPINEVAEKSKKFFDQALQKIVSNQNQNQELAQLRDWLLPMLMNGQVTVGEVEEKMGMVAEDRVNY